MLSEIIVLDGGTFFYTESSGDVDAEHAEGLFYQDVRHLSRWQLLIDGKPLKVLTGRRVDYCSARMVGIPASSGPVPAVSVRRDRFVSEGVHEDVVLENLSLEAVEIEVELRFGSDFADVMEAPQGVNTEGHFRVERRSRSITLWHERDGYLRATAITFSRRPRLTANKAAFPALLRPGETWSLCVDLTPIVDGRRRPPLLRCDSFGRAAAKMPVSLDEWMGHAPVLEADSPQLAATYRQSLLDLAALRIRPDRLRIHRAMPGGGMPWFMTVFGRDSLITAYEALPFQPELACTTLEALASLQATEWDNFRDAEPGKMPHELRRGTLAALGKIPHTPYYGSHDATLLWLILLDEYERWSGDAQLVRELEPSFRAALAWLEGPADLDGDGYLEYRKRSSSDKALDNHCWKDSRTSIRFADGRIAEPPIATAELQGYAYDARLRTARLLRTVSRDDETAERLDRDAARLKQRFNRDFWHPGRRHYVLALDGDKRQVDSLTSNTGHLLWSGIVERRRAKSVVRRLLRRDMFSGWGIRTMSTEDAAYNPLDYHNGTVWPHDTAIVAEGFRRYGFRAEAGRLCLALLDAAEAFASQLPEVFAGFGRDETNVPVEYEGALKPQSWAAGAPLLVLRTLLGLDVVDGRLRRHPAVPAELGRLRLDGIVTSRRTATRRRAARRAGRGDGATAARGSGDGRPGG
jgi:glycogen debranching enzyme